MKKFLTLFLVLTLVLSCVPCFSGLAKEKVTLSLLTSRHDFGTNDIEDVWFFQYLEKYISEKCGVDLEFELEQTRETEDRIALMLATGDLLDLVWGINLSTINAVTYGAGEGMLLDWSTLLTDELMPNAKALLDANPDALLAATCLDGKIYGLPTLLERDYYDYTGGISNGLRLYVRQSWLDACGYKEQPSTLNEFIDMLRVFKNVETADGEPAIPVVENANFFKYFIWGALGFTGNSHCGAYGTNFAIKNGEVVLPFYSEEYREFVRLFNMMYSEGLISEDFFTMDSTTAAGLQEGGRCGVMGNWTLGGMTTSYMDWVAVQPITSDWCEKMIFSNWFNYTTASTWASAETKHPEILAAIMDYMYTPEGATLYLYGPMAGEEEKTIGMGMVEGWYLLEDGAMTNKPTQEGKFTAYQYYTNMYVQSMNNPAMSRIGVNKHAWAKAGYDLPYTAHTLTDALTGEPFIAYEIQPWMDNNASGHWRITSVNAWQNNVTNVKLPIVYLTIAENNRANDLKIALETYVSAETAKFIVGERQLTELDDYFETLRKLGVEEYIDIYKTAYKPYMDSIFAK